MHLADVLKRTSSNDNDVSFVFPFEFSTEPISEASVDPSLTFNASIYCPLGIKRSSTLLFILPCIKFL